MHGRGPVLVFVTVPVPVMMITMMVMMMVVMLAMMAMMMMMMKPVPSACACACASASAIARPSAISATVPHNLLRLESAVRGLRFCATKVKHRDKWYSRNNRRLWCFKEAGVTVVEARMDKWTTTSCEDSTLPAMVGGLAFPALHLQQVRH